MRHYDYAQDGAYFLTLCVQGRECLFGEIGGDEVRLNEFGAIALRVWEELPRRFACVELDAFVIMPNHMHGIVILREPVGAGFPRPELAGASRSEALGMQDKPRRRPAIGNIVAYYKYQSTKMMNETRGTPGTRIWQRNYYEHVVRSDEPLCKLRDYIASNPLRWRADQLHPENPSKW